MLGHYRETRGLNTVVAGGFPLIRKCWRGAPIYKPTNIEKYATEQRCTGAAVLGATHNSWDGLTGMKFAASTLPLNQQ